MAGTKSRKAAGDKQRSLVIRREEPADEPAHGGAWKVAYADFVTAMMAFFLVMWLINATTQAQRVGLADYFSQQNVLNRGASGEGKIFGGRTPFDHGELSSDSGSIQVRPGRNPAPSGEKKRHATTAELGQSSGHVKPAPPRQSSRARAEAKSSAAPAAPAKAGHGAGVRPEQASAAAAKAAGAHAASTGHGGKLRAAANDIKSAIAASPILSQIRSHVSIRQTSRMLEIQIIDTKKHPMFALGSPAPNPKTKLLLQRITPILTRLKDKIRIEGYTDARPFKGPGMNNWTLSVERANATRDVMVSAGLPEAQVSEISGFADHRLLIPDDPLAAANRRIAIMVLHKPAQTGPGQAKTP